MRPMLTWSPISPEGKIRTQSSWDRPGSQAKGLGWPNEDFYSDWSQSDDSKFLSRLVCLLTQARSAQTKASLSHCIHARYIPRRDIFTSKILIFSTEEMQC